MIWYKGTEEVHNHIIMEHSQKKADKAEESQNEMDTDDNKDKTPLTEEEKRQIRQIREETFVYHLLEEQIRRYEEEYPWIKNADPDDPNLSPWERFESCQYRKMCITMNGVNTFFQVVAGYGEETETEKRKKEEQASRRQSLLSAFESPDSRQLDDEIIETLLGLMKGGRESE